MNYSDYSTSDLLAMYARCINYSPTSFDDQEANTEQMQHIAYELRVTRKQAI